MAFDAGDVVSRLLLDMTDFRRALKSAPGIAKKDLAKVERGMTKTMQAASKAEEKFVRDSQKRGERFQKSWWSRFGAVAVGFTVAYRAMQVVQRGVEELVGSFTKGIKEIDEFRMSVVEVAASLQMLTEQPSTEGLKAYYAFARSVFEDLEMLAVKHISTGEDLRNAYAKLATMGIVPQTEEQLEQMARMVDLVLIQTRGLDKQRQIRTELQAFVKGEMRQGAVVARMMRQRVKNYEDLIKNVKEESDVAKKTQMIFAGTAKILDSVGSVSEAIMNTHTAWLATLQAIINRIWRAGLYTMYEDLLSLMRKIYDVMIDQNQLTETAIKLAYGYDVAWKTVKMILEGVYNTGVGIYTTWVSLTGELDIITSLFKVFAADVVIIRHGFRVSALLLDYIVTKVREWVTFQLDPGLQKNEKELIELMKEREWVQERMLTLALKRVGLEADLAKGVDGSKRKLEALHEISLKYNTIWKSINLQIRSTESLLEPSLFTFDDLTEKVNELNKEVLITLTEIADLGTGLDFEKFKKQLEARLVALRAHMKAVLDLQTGNLLGDATARKKFDTAWFKTMLDKHDYAVYLAQKEYKEFSKYEDLKAKAAILLTEKLKQLEDKRLEKQLTTIRDMYKGMIGYEEEYLGAASALIDKQADEREKLLRGVLGAEEAEVLAKKWAANEKMKLNEAVRQSNIKLFQSTMDQTASVVDSWTWMFQQLGKKSKDAFNTYKNLQYLQAVIEALTASVRAYAWGWGPWSGPAAPYVASAAMATAFATAMVKAAMISGMQYQGYAGGGWIDKHPKRGRINEGAGGVDDVFLGSTPGVNHWAARDEFVMNPVASKKYARILEAMNMGLAGGGWINKGYLKLPNPFKDISQATQNIGLPDPIGDWKDFIDGFKVFTEPSLYDPDLFDNIVYSISQMLGETTALDDMIKSTKDQFKGWIKQAEDMGESEERLQWIRDQENVVINKLVADIRDNFLKPLEDIWQKGVMTDYGYELLQLSKWYEEQKTLAEDLNYTTGDLINAMNNLDAAYASQREEIEATRAAIEEGITRRLGELLEAATPGAGLSQAELAIYDLTNEFVAIVEQIQGWQVETGQDFSQLITDTTQLYELEMEAALAQSEAAQEIESAIADWISIVDDLDNTIYDLQTSIANPASTVERMGIVRGMIDAFPEVTTPEQAAELQALWMDYLDLAQETYQRPSAEYQAIYGEMIDALESIKDNIVAEDTGLIALEESNLAIATDINAVLGALTGTEAGSISDYLSSIVTGIQAGVPIDVTLTAADFTVTIPDVGVDVAIPDIVLPDITIPDVDVNVTVDDIIMQQQKTILDKLLAESYVMTAVGRQIVSNTYSIGMSTYLLAGGAGGFAASYAPIYAKYGGVFSGPESGYPVMLHGIEEVTPVGKSKSHVEFNLNLTIKESKTPRETAAEVEVRIENFLRRGRGRKLMQEAAEGR